MGGWGSGWGGGGQGGCEWRSEVFCENSKKIKKNLGEGGRVRGGGGSGWGGGGWGVRVDGNGELKLL